jgi:hypothetical protein
MLRHNNLPETDMRSLFSLLLLLPLLAGTLVFAGCDGAQSTSGSATVRVLLTDFPFDYADEANVTIERVELIRQGGGVQLLAEFDEPLAFNLLELRDGVTALLTEIVIPGGVYEQLRIVVGQDAEVVLMAGSEDEQRYDLRVPSGTETGIKINLPQIVIDEEDEEIEIIADFNVEESFIVLGNPSTPAGINGFNFRPVLHLQYLEVNGEVLID